MAAVFTFPLGHGVGRLGALDLYRDVPGELAAQDLAAAQTLADVAAAYLVNARARRQALEAAEQFRTSALHDALTGLPNRLLLQQRLEHAAQRARRSHSTSGVLFVDLDRFKRVNDTYGHGVGDELLVAVAGRLSALLRPGDTLARVSGDEFVILCEDLAQPGDAELLVTRLDAAFATAFPLERVELVMTASVGVAYCGPGEAITDQLLVAADTAMYQAKRSGGATHRGVDVHFVQQVRDRAELEKDLRAALNRRNPGELDLDYQPIVRTVDGLVVGVEALLRWTHPVLGLVASRTVIEVAERSALIADVGLWILERACQERVRWIAEHPRRPLELTVNVSGLQLVHPGYCASVSAVLAATGMDPGALVLDVNEEIIVDQDERALTALTELTALGVRVAVDDFGSGVSSLGVLRRMPVDRVKLDRSVVAELGHDRVTTALVQGVTRLAAALDLTVAAEGVETEQQRRALTGLGCALAQGLLYAPSMTGADVTTRLLAVPGGVLPRPREQAARYGAVPRQPACNSTGSGA